MNTADRVLALKLVTDVGDISKQMKGVEKSTKRVAGRFKDMGSAAKSWGKAIGGAFILSGLEALPGIIGDLNAGFKAGNDAARNLGITWKNLGLDGDKLAGTIADVSGLALDMGFDDAEVVSAFDTFLGLTGDSDKALGALGQALDLARAKGWPLGKAVKYVSKHLGDNDRALDSNKGKAEAWAKSHPIEVTAGKIVDALENITGALGTGDWDTALKNLGVVGEELDNLLFGNKQTVDLGSAGVVTIRTGGLINRFLDVGGKLVSAVVDGLADLGPKIQDWWDTSIASVDWLKAVQDGIANVFSAITADPDKTGNVLLAGVAIGGILNIGIFAVSKAKAALSALMKAPGFLVGVGVKAAGAAIGLIFNAGLFALDALVSALSYAMVKLQVSSRVLAGVRAMGTYLGKIGGGKFMIAFVAAAVGVHMLDALADEIRKFFHLPADLPIGFPGLGTYAEGTDSAARGWALVGEKGPELMRMSGGEQILPAGSFGGGGSQVINVTINAGVGDPVAIGREVDRVLRIYRKRAGILSAGQMI